MSRPPFPAEYELCKKLALSADKSSIQSTSSATNTSKQNHLPSQPRIKLSDPNIGSFLQDELLTKDLNRLSPRLWLVATQDSSHISSLTHQIFRGRQVVVTEKPELHLVWYFEQVYIKPIPEYLMSHAFWDYYLISQNSPIPSPQRKDIYQAALGFMRSYAYLIKHESDFWLARSHDGRPPLIPKISYEDFQNFIAFFETVSDEDVSPRFYFGELRLTRLNFWSKIFLRRQNYQKTHGQYVSYFSKYYAPVVFIFGILSVILSALQVALAVQSLDSIFSGHTWITFAQFSRVFSIMCLFIVAVVIIGWILLFALMGLRETIFALRTKHKKNREEAVEASKEASPGNLS
jgi:hypothetical protein